MVGVFIVLEGTDGSGKGTQFRLLVDRLTKEGVRFEQADFPRYGTPAAYFVEQYLTGKYGAAKDVPPNVASLFYALDRYDAAPGMRSALEAGTHLISNRYTTSNLGHQGGKAKDTAERKRVVAAIEALEYGELRVPRPNLVLLLKMHPFVAQQLIALKAQRAYLNGGKKDIHEGDLDHLTRAAESYLFVAKRDPTWVVIDCMKHLPKRLLLDAAVSPLEKVKSVEQIHALVWAEVHKRLVATPLG